MDRPAKINEAADAAPTGSAPEHKVHYGRVDVAVWRRQADDGRARYSFTASRSYKVRDDQWQRTASLDEEDLLAAARALERPTPGLRSSDRPPGTVRSGSSAARPRERPAKGRNIPHRGRWGRRYSLALAGWPCYGSPHEGVRRRNRSHRAPPLHPGGHVFEG